MRNFTLFFIGFFLFANVQAQYSEELVEYNYKDNQLESIKLLPSVVYLDPMRGGVAINTVHDLYHFTGISNNGDSKVYSLDINTGEIKYEVAAPEFSQFVYDASSDKLIGLHKKVSGEVFLGILDYRSGTFTNNLQLFSQDGLSFSNHQSVIDNDRGCTIMSALCRAPASGDFTRMTSTWALKLDTMLSLLIIAL